MIFTDFFTRLDEESAEQILGQQAIKILNTLDSNLTRVTHLQKAILKVYSPFGLLTDKSKRNILLDLLKPDEAKELLALVNIPLQENEYNTLKGNNFTSSKYINKLLSFFELPEISLVKNSIIASEKEQKSTYPLFKHQRAAIRKLDKLLYEENKRVLLHMPTGSGKTRTAINVICNHFRKNEPTVVIWLANTEELCEQASQEFEKAWSSLGDREILVTRYWGNANSDLSQMRDGLIVCGLSKIYNLLRKNSSTISILGSRTTLVVMDEAHMAIAPTFQTSIEILISVGTGASLLGLSATPGRTWNDPQADEELSLFFNKKKVTLMVDGYANPVDYLVDEGYLARVKNSPLLYNSGTQVSEKDLKHLKDFLELPESFLKELSEDQARNILIVQKLEDLVTRHKRVILFALNVKHANLFAVCLQARNVNAYSITSQTEASQRKSLIENFKQDSTGPIVLCNYGILTTGFDAPKTSCAVICRPTDSLVLYSQMVGRAIRGPKAGGNANSEIITVVDTQLPGFEKVQDSFFNWEDVW